MQAQLAQAQEQVAATSGHAPGPVPSPVGAVVKARLLFETGASGSTEQSPSGATSVDEAARTRRVLEWDEVFWGRREVALELGERGTSAAAARASVLAVRSGTAEEEKEAEADGSGLEDGPAGLSVGLSLSRFASDPGGDAVGQGTNPDGGGVDAVLAGLGLSFDAPNGGASSGVALSGTMTPPRIRAGGEQAAAGTSDGGRIPPDADGSGQLPHGLSGIPVSPAATRSSSAMAPGSPAALCAGDAAFAAGADSAGEHGQTGRTSPAPLIGADASNQAAGGIPAATVAKVPAWLPAALQPQSEVTGDPRWLSEALAGVDVASVEPRGLAGPAAGVESEY